MTTAKVITPMQTAIARDSARAGISAFNWRAYAARILEKSASFKSEGRVSLTMTADESVARAVIARQRRPAV
jgi:hypothetical protein